MENKKKLTVTVDYDNDGLLVIDGAKTLERYEKLRNEIYTINLRDYDMFMAFDADGFRCVKESIRPLKEGEKLLNIGQGIFGTKDGYERYQKTYHNIYMKIAKECNPQEVYYYEYNNFECFYRNSDTQAMRIIIYIFGYDVANTIERLNGLYTVNEIMTIKNM